MYLKISNNIKIKFFDDEDMYTGLGMVIALFTCISGVLVIILPVPIIAKMFSEYYANTKQQEITEAASEPLLHFAYLTTGFPTSASRTCSDLEAMRPLRHSV